MFEKEAKEYRGGIRMTKKELEKENAELKKQLEMSDKVYNDNLDYSYHIKGQLTKAKDIIKELVKGIRITFEHRGFITNVDAFLLKAEQFLNEVER